MHRNKKGFLWVSSLLLLSGCATVQNYQSTVNTWNGVSKKTLFHVWGLPDSEMQMPQGRQIYVYRSRRKISGTTNLGMVSGQSYIMRSNATPQAQYATCTTWFSVNGMGKVDHVRFQGDACQASDGFKKRYSAP